MEWLALLRFSPAKPENKFLALRLISQPQLPPLEKYRKTTTNGHKVSRNSETRQ